jgi:hypothetical protein
MYVSIFTNVGCIIKDARRMGGRKNGGSLGGSGWGLRRWVIKWKQV